MLDRFLGAISLLGVVFTIWFYFQINWSAVPEPVVGKILLALIGASSLGNFFSARSAWRRKEER